MAEYTAKEVAQHNVPGNYWIILHGKVYDVSSYLDDHPGGKDVLKEVAGTDASSDFDFTGHSEDAKRALGGFLVGSLAGHTAKKERTALRVISPLGTRTKFGSRIRLPNVLARLKTYLCLVGAAAALAMGSRFWEIPSIGTSGFHAGVLTTLAAVASVGWWCFVWLRRALFPVHEVFEYPPYY